MIEARGHKSTVHLSLEDKSGDSAIVEYVDGKRTIHHIRTYTIQTNEPPYQAQLDLLNQQDFSNPTDSMPLPGNVSPIDRFQRAAYFSALLPEPNNDRATVSDGLAIVRNVSIPFGAPHEGFGVF
jgi:choloylglycine hydrolase